MKEEIVAKTTKTTIFEVQILMKNEKRVKNKRKTAYLLG